MTIGRAVLVLLLLAGTTPGAGQSVSRGGVLKPRTCVGSCIHVTKQSSTEWRIVTPVSGAPQTYQVEWRLKTSPTTPVSASGPIWNLQGVYGRDLAAPGDVQLSDASDTSVYEYAWFVGVADAPSSGFDFYGNGHGGEMLSSQIGFVLDGIDISSVDAGSTRDGQSLVVTQNKNFLLPKNADGTANLSTPIGTGTTMHTFSATGMLVGHTHTFSAGYQGYTLYAAMLPGSAANFNRVSVNGGSAYTIAGDGSVQFTGTRITSAAMWHATAHHFKMNLSLPSGGPAVPSDWSHAGPDYGFLVDEAARPKIYVLYVNDKYASRVALSTLGVGGTITQSQQYSVSYQ